MSLPDARGIPLPRSSRERGVLLVLAGLAVQIPLCLVLAHAYDAPIFMATGYLTASGANPYVPRDLTEVFRSPLFQGMTSIGYPPPWALVLGAVYSLTYAGIPDILLYNLAIKIPVIAASVILSFMAGRLARLGGAGEKESDAVLTFLLFNPLIVIASAWCQFDVVVALCALLSLLLLSRGMTALSALALAMAVSLKPTALALVPLAVLAARYGYAKNARFPGRLVYGAAFSAGMFAFCVVPFLLFHWDPSIIIKGWNSHFTVAGGLSFLSFMELADGSSTLPSPLGFLGFLWVPALAVGSLLLRPKSASLEELLDKGLRLTLIFFLCRAWLSEPNVVLILPMAAILAARGRLSKKALMALWAIPVAFAFFNTSLAQLFTFVWDAPMAVVRSIDERMKALRIIARSFMVIPWLLVGWRIVIGVEARNAHRLSRPGGTRLTLQRAPAHAGRAAPPPQGIKLSVVIPTYNESLNILEVISRIEGSLAELRKTGFELIIVDDDSPDGTRRLASRAALERRNIRVLDRKAKDGLAGAIMEGVRAARGEYVAVMDGDLQHPPESLPALLDRLEDGADLAIMSRYAPGARRLDGGLARRLVSRGAIAVTHFLLPPTRRVRDPISGFFMARARLLACLSPEPSGFKVLPQLIIHCRPSRISELAYAFQARRGGRSKMRLRQILLYARLLFSLRGECRS